MKVSKKKNYNIGEHLPNLKIFFETIVIKAVLAYG